MPRLRAGVGRHVRVNANEPRLPLPAVTGLFKIHYSPPRQSRHAGILTDHEITTDLSSTNSPTFAVLICSGIFLAAIVCAIHWFNPLVWLARKSAELDRELAADGAVLKQLQTSERQHYGLTLLAVSTSPRPSLLLAAAIGESGSRLTLRLRRVNDSPRVSLFTALPRVPFHFRRRLRESFTTGVAAHCRSLLVTTDHAYL